MKRLILTIGLCLLCYVVTAQKIIDLSSRYKGGVSYTPCYDASKPEPYKGAKVNGKLVVPCKYDFIYGRGGTLFAYPNDNHDGPADVYTPEGKLLFPVSMGIFKAIEVEDCNKVYFQATDYSLYNSNGTYLMNPKRRVYSSDFDGCDLPGISSSNSSSTATSSSSKPASSNSEPRLIFKGPYTQDCGSGPMYMFISVYEDRLYDGSTVFQYKSTNSSGERIYAGPGMFGSYSKWTVNTKTQNVRLVNTYSSQWGSSTKSCSVSKGHDFDQRVSFGSGYAPSTYSGSGSGSNSSSGTSTNPVQPHQKTKSCTLCNGSGKCANCNGKGWHYGYGGSTVNCSNCSRNGRCPSCGGSGKKTTTEYY